LSGPAWKILVAVPPCSSLHSTENIKRDATNEESVDLGEILEISGRRRCDDSRAVKFF